MAEPCSRLPLPGNTFRDFRTSTCWDLYYRWRASRYVHVVVYSILAGLQPETRRRGILAYNAVNTPLVIVHTPVAGRVPYIVSVHPPLVTISYEGSSMISNFDLATGRYR